MFKFKTTNKDIYSKFNRVIKVGYCDLSNLLSCNDAFAYNSGVYGWSCDFHDLGDGVCLSTGYRPIGEAVDNKLIKNYENMAKKINSSDLSFDVKKKKIINLQNKFVNELNNCKNYNK